MTSLVRVFSPAACGSQQAGTSAGSEAASTASSETASTAGSEAASAAQTKTEEQLLAEENDILNHELWEKVFASMDKNVTQTTLKVCIRDRSMAVLQGKGPADLTEVCLQLASNMLYLAGKGEMLSLIHIY